MRRQYYPMWLKYLKAHLILLEKENLRFLSDTVIANIGGESSSSIDFWLSICKTLKINWCVSYLTSKLAGIHLRLD